jgi:hypothetical protein
MGGRRPPTAVSTDSPGDAGRRWPGGSKARRVGGAAEGARRRTAAARRRGAGGGRAGELEAVNGRGGGG